MRPYEALTPALSHPWEREPLRWGALLSLSLVLACGSNGDAHKRGDDAAASASDASKAECSSHKDCVGKHEKHWICRRPEHTCVSLLSPECTFVRGDDADDDAIFVGVLSPEGGGGQLFGASDLTREDFTDAVGGLPRAGENAPRPFVLVGCSFPALGDPLPGARHLIEVIGVPAIIGPASSPDVINVAQNVAIPAGVFVISPTAQSDLLTDLADEDLVFRTAPTTTAIAPQLAAMLTDVEAVVRSERALTEIKVALVSDRGAYGIALSTATAKVLHFNGGLSTDENERRGQFRAVSYDAADKNFERDVAERVFAFAPDVVILETAFDVRAFKAIEEAWPADSPSPPYYVADAGGGGPDQIKFVASRPDSLRARIRVVSTLDPKRSLYQGYTERINHEFGGSSLLHAAASVYDAAYAVAYGIVAAESPLTGRTIARGVRRLVGSGKRIETVSAQIETGVLLLRAGNEIDLDGASGPLDFDAHGDVRSDGSVDCLVRDKKTGDVVLAFSGQIYRASSGKLEGSFKCD